MNNKITICYERLSRDDYKDGGESGSIANQRDILQSYAEQNGLLPCKHISEIKLRNLIQINFECANIKSA
jgi:hypothetical protein